MPFDFTPLLKVDPQDPLRKEVSDAAWADFGRNLHRNLHNNAKFCEALTRASLKSKTTMELVAMLRCYIMTGTLP